MGHIKFSKTALAICLLASVQGANMNGKYSVASGGRQDVSFNDDYASKGHEYFDVYTPELTTQYGDLYMGNVGPIRLPDSIVRRFDGKVMAITGYEFDQVMVEPVGAPGHDSSADFSVPINWVYNHHYTATMSGRHTQLREVPTIPEDRAAGILGHTKVVPVDLPSAAEREDPSIPTSQQFSEGNGGEARKSFHGYPDGFAQLVDSPVNVSVFVMSIDTRNRDCGIDRRDIDKCIQFTPGPEPKQARYGRGVPPGGTNYSGLVECPCTSRFGGDPLFYPQAHTKRDGKLCETWGNKCSGEIKDRCAPEPKGDLLAQANPTCSGATYSGGIQCCQVTDGMRASLLDADQERRPELLHFHLKFRFWFEEYRPETKSHVDLKRMGWLTEWNAGEYDVPPAFAQPGLPIVGYPGWPAEKPTPGTTCTGKCPDGPDCDCVHTITGHNTVSNIRLIYGSGHCHAPACLSMELFRNDTGTPQLLCRQLPMSGSGASPAERFDEPGYIRIPPCLWSDSDPSLEKSQWLPANTPLVSIIRVRNTHVGHYGNMAMWQMRGVTFPAEESVLI